MPAAVQHWQPDLPFAILELEGRTTLTVEEVANALRCTSKHVIAMIHAEELCAINVGLGERVHPRVPVEAFRDFVMRSLTCDFEASPLRTLPDAALVRMHRELTQHLTAKGIQL